jgi:hypothetical protein
VLVVCPERYLKAIIPNSTRFARLQRRRTVLSPRALDIIRSWEEKGILYRWALLHMSHVWKCTGWI